MINANKKYRLDPRRQKGGDEKNMNKSERQDLNPHYLLPRQACYPATPHPVIARRSTNGAGGPLPAASIHHLHTIMLTCSK